MNTHATRKIQDFMLDTVALKLTCPDFKILRSERFTPHLVIKRLEEFSYIADHRKLYQKYTQNPTAEDKKEGFYKPRLTVYRRCENNILSYDLIAEFSIPKMVFGDNLQELRNSDFDEVLSILKTRLLHMGVETTEGTIKQAKVTRAHFGKNILLPYPRTSQEAIRELEKAELGKSMDVNIRHYGNGGEALYFYTSARNLIFYDKVKDIEKTKNKAVDKERTKQEKAMLQSGLLEKREILRFEIRLNTQATIKSWLNKVLNNKTEEATFEKIFDETLCRAIVWKSWEDIIDRPANQLALKMQISDDEILNALIAREQKGTKGAHSMNKVIQSFGLYSVINKLGVRHVRDKLEKNWSEKSCRKRLDNKIKLSAVSLSEIPATEIITVINEELKQFKRFETPQGLL